jgi:hypothetical protein
MRIASSCLILALFLSVGVHAQSLPSISSYPGPAIAYTILGYFFAYYPADLQNVVNGGTTLFTASSVTQGITSTWATDSSKNIWIFSNGGVAANANSWSKVTTATTTMPTAAAQFNTDFLGNTYWLNANGTITAQASVSITTPVSLTIEFYNTIGTGTYKSMGVGPLGFLLGGGVHAVTTGGVLQSFFGSQTNVGTSAAGGTNSPLSSCNVCWTTVTGVASIGTPS